MCPSSSQPLPSLLHSNPVSSFLSVFPSSHTPNPPSPLTNNHKTISSKTKPSPKTTSNKPTYLPNHPQLIYTYPPSALTTPSPQTQHTTSPRTQSSFHPSSPSRNNLRILQWNANGIRPRRTELLHFLSHNQYDLIFIQESHLSSDSTFRIPGYKTLQKDRFMTRRGTTNSTGNLGGGVLILVKNGLSYTSLSSLEPSSDYLAIAVKIKGAAPIHLFNVYVPPIRSSSSDSRPKSFSPFLLPLTSLATLTAIIHPGTPTHRKTIQAKICLIGSSLLIFYLLITPNTTPYFTVPPETALPLIFP